MRVRPECSAIIGQSFVYHVVNYPTNRNTWLLSNIPALIYYCLHLDRHLIVTYINTGEVSSFTIRQSAVKSYSSFGTRKVVHSLLRVV